MNHAEIPIQLQKEFPGLSLKTVRESILIEDSAKLVDVATFLQSNESFQMDFLTSVTASDFLNYFEVIYHFYSTSKKESSPLVLRVRTSRENPEVPSLSALFKSADFQERQAFDLFGIKFTGHPDPRRIFMWEGFEGFPLRKDYVQEDSDVLEIDDVLWLEKHGINVTAEQRENAETLKADGKRAISEGPTEKPGP